MSDETSPSQIKISWLIGIAIAFVLFAAIGGYSARMTRDYTDYDEERAAQRYDNLKKLQADENKQLNPVDAKGKPTAVWIDQDKGIISIPIEQAMEKEVADLKTKTAGPGNEINPPAPAPPAPAAAPSTNAAPVAPPAPPAKPAPVAKPSAPAKPVKTTSSQPGFKTRSISTALWIREGQNIWVKGTLIPAKPELATPQT